ncbi:MAG: hypothetical protein A2W90_04000 [Bacteroidetes bacterium GWF2_42_66]|nr:MAG: hypothetical protein A2W92_07795 [Bacteroidetes bacterium GWA2_42_15]OFY02514.1 MAG: hypothetical protein A2W89_21855 [Bacteroidetes bacterium GWE2_42_39]OFY41388.1 MAG: hypothetical protein A2W90_04000 [Bacteroidetes bacterium GWF2_42_66]HBL75409.1 organic solvent tolerance protein OstA [Prolixibacteraceae bacterium]HCR90978.1 organic solvent tolerance protein OstA [Prolixibacteraceae bacterium]
MVVSLFQYRKIALLIFVLDFFFTFQAEAQKEKKRIEIERANSFEYNDKIVANAQRIIGDVLIRHNTILMWCDSAWSYTDKNMVDGFGHVHILKDDTLNLYADFINYDGDRKFAKARRNVKLENKGTTLITDSLDFNMAANVGYYDYFGTITDSANVLTSMIGQYFTQTDMAHFKKDVVATTDKYRLFSDTLIYKVSEKTAYIVGPTTIEDDSTTLYTENGFYNTVTGETQLLKNPKITDRKHKVLADSIFYNKITGDGRAVGDVHIEDFENRMIVKGNWVVFNELENTSLATDSALFIQYSEKDSLYLHADTLRMMPDTTGVDARLIKAYYKVKFYRDDMQGKCDSLVYWSKDSTIQLFNEPVIWTGGNQMTARYIEMIKNTGKPDEVMMKNDAFIIAMEPDSIRFNQIKGRNMTGYVRNNELFKIFVDGNGQSLYYARDKEGIIGLNKAESSSITITMEKNKVKRIAFVSNPEGVLNPIPQLQEEDTKLPGFTWMDLLRPKTILDIFRGSAEP